MDINTFSAKQCAIALADAKISTTDRKAIIARVKAKVAEGKHKRWANLLKDINAGETAKIQARAGVISWEQAKANAPAKPAPKAQPAEPEALDLSEMAALLAKPIPSKADRDRILALASKHA